tara:strand:- start:4778 stop:5119 length:342 start_codon:yes stop_codon:yes gene_type:complete
MSLRILFLPVTHQEVKQQEQNIHDKRDRIETKHKKMDTSVDALRAMSRDNEITREMDRLLNDFDLRNNPFGGYKIVSVTPVLETKAEKVDVDEPMMPFVTTTGFLIMLHRNGE